MWRNDIKCKYMFVFSLKKLARKGLSYNTQELKLRLPSWSIQPINKEGEYADVSLTENSIVGLPWHMHSYILSICWWHPIRGRSALLTLCAYCQPKPYQNNWYWYTRPVYNNRYFADDICKYISMKVDKCYIWFHWNRFQGVLLVTMHHWFT